jgi:glutamyl-tRNA reductase
MAHRVGILAVTHRRVSLAELGALAPCREAIEAQARAMVARGELEELVVLGTCNRFELIYAARDPALAGEALRALLPDAIAGPAEMFVGEAALRHLLLVASSLDSLLLGEGQILAQVRAARDAARARRTIGPRLEIVLDHAFAAAKEVRTRTTLGDGRVSVASLAARSVTQLVRAIPQPVAAVIGAGEMARKAALHLKSQPLGGLIIVNRTRTRAEALAAELGAGAQAMSLEEFLAAPPVIDVLVTAASAPEPLITARELARLIERQEAARAMVPFALVDLAVPGNIAVAELPARCRLYRLDDLRAEAEQNMQRRQSEVAVAEEIVTHKLAVLCRRLSERTAIPVLQKIERETARVQETEVERWLKRELNHLCETDKRLVREFAAQLARRCAHSSMPALKELGMARAEPAAP